MISKTIIAVLAVSASSALADGSAIITPVVITGGSPTAPVCVVPKIISPGSGCCSYSIANNVTKKFETYNQPGHVFGNEDDARAYAGTVHAKMPFFEPIGSGERLVGGWFYDNGGFHAAADYMKNDLSTSTDPSFLVHAVANGKVLSVYWDDWLGNTVVVEHTAGDGSKYRSVYNHVRNGFTNDLAHARAIDLSKYGNPPDTSNWSKYKKYAMNPNPDPRFWGGDDQVVLVKVGDQVSSGQVIAHSGDTGAGGAGNGLDVNGNPTDSRTANVHLHLFVAVPHPTIVGRWMFIDPYGVYQQVNTGCYALLKDTWYQRLYAAYYPSFHNISAMLLDKYQDYYRGMGMGMRTLGLHFSDLDLHASGSFQYGLDSTELVTLGQQDADFQQIFNTLSQDGYRPRAITATANDTGDARFGAIWKKTSGEAYFVFHKLGDADFNSQVNQLVGTQHYRIEDHMAYVWNGVRRHAAIFVKDGSSNFVYAFNYSPVDYQNFFNWAYGAGYRQTSLYVAEVSGGESMGGEFYALPGSWPVHWGLSAAQYQQVFSDYDSKGYQLYKVQGYNNSRTYDAIWLK